MSRVPFDYTLIDRRHKAFVQGKRAVLLPLRSVLFNSNNMQPFIVAVVGICFLVWSIQGFIHQFAVRNDWVVTEATITAVVPLQNGNDFNWHFIYAFRTESSLQVQGKIVEDYQRAFNIDQRIPVHYVRTDPTENRYANEFLPRPFLDWFLLVLGLVVLYPAAQVVRHVLPTYRTLKSISRQGHALPGEIIGIHHPSWHTQELNVEVEYVFISPTGASLQGCETIDLVNVAQQPLKPSTIVAIWYVSDSVALLL